ncbi:MAG: LysM peptidoglycan-binding domain-containing protein [Ruminococcus sp.]|nr:LysM peptidoglycan-binding domain-containing protein [Ruminococcus sp.]
MERQIPKNVRQIGNVSNTPKIYVEDYVDTFFAQLCEKAGDEPVGAFLIGDFQNSQSEEYVYIYGAVQMHKLTMSGTEYVLDEETWKHAYEDCKQYFEDGEMLGWFVACPGSIPMPDFQTVQLHKKAFPKENTVLILKDTQEKEEVYFVHRMNDLLEISGHYTYYEKNPSMQNYMISTRKKNGVSPTETVEDRAAKDFRSIVRSREERARQRRTNRIMYAVSTCLVLLVVVMGVAMLNNFDKMKSVQTALDNMSQTAPDEVLEGDVIETSGVIAEAENPEVTAAEGSADLAESADGQAEAEDAESTDVSSDGETLDIQVVPETAQGDSNANGSDGVYVVEEGDTLAIISRKMYGDISHVDSICAMNGLTDGNLIYVGQKLLLP